MNDPETGQAASQDGTDLAEFLGEQPRPRWRRWLKWGLIGLAVLLLALLIARCAGGKGEPDYFSEPVRKASLSLTVTATGSIRPTNMVQVGSEISGKIDKIMVDVNDRVTKGQVVAVINTDVIDDQIRQARANLDAAKASVEQAKATLDVDAAQLARLQTVYEASAGKVPSKTELQAAEGAVTRDRATIASARANVVAMQATLSSAQTTRSRAVIRSPVSGVVLARQVEPGQTVAASFNTPTLFIIAEDLSAMQLRVSIDEADIGQVHAGDKAQFTVDAYPGRKFDAVVDRVDLASTNTASTLNASSNAAAGGNTDTVVEYEARLTVDNADGLLRPGMTATATIATASTGQQLLVPNSALRFKPDHKKKEEGGVLNPQIGLQQAEQQASIGIGSTQQVYVLEPDGTLKPIKVVTGQSDGRMTVVKAEALKAGIKVVTGIKAKGT
ncbi:efflux RND transporter periplasmic adaptor subunit [Novosphingobium beihaiensis]|uniref:Efflux RND transporter periplasmic adaptor subunit n=1 Tax=Novosphingobium beihaiensis TaxID=2930389 RepID=A0ABT0BSM8_9SPHN|nr:efflux RND transporter periplasmic adaptor subunit [Novosphingobium beihaiensis]MCJ2187664.1 efflux RND transporter periplasmic adaptor subunit [Novosphingobium beihaiensis]